MIEFLLTFLSVVYYTNKNKSYSNKQSITKQVKSGLPQLKIPRTAAGVYNIKILLVSVGHTKNIRRFTFIEFQYKRIQRI